MRKYCFIFLLVLIWGCNASEKSRELSHTAFDNEKIKASLDRVANWQISNHTYSSTKNLHDYGIDSWTNATLYLGLYTWANTVENANYLRWLTQIGESTDWKPASNFKYYPSYQLYHADEFCIAQFYLNMYDLTQSERMMKHVRERAQWVMDNPAKPGMNYRNKQAWTWCDALFMAPPVYAHLAAIENNDRYLAFMHAEFQKTYAHLYDHDNQLFFRDDSYFDKVENNGAKVFWGRGNGWVAAGLVNLLKVLPDNSSYRPFYEDLFREFVPRLIALQGENGFWHASLLDPVSYPAPETSATALITYATAYGINNGLLDKATSMPALTKAWSALQSAINDNGKLGWVQPIGADPKKVTSDMTANYGVGAFLLAGSELYKMQ